LGENYGEFLARKGVETTFSMLEGLFLRKIHAVTFGGFLLKK